MGGLVLLFLKWCSHTVIGRIIESRKRINALITNWQTQVGAQTEGIIQEMIKYLAVNPYFTTKKIVERFGIAFTTAQRAIEKLKGLGIVTQSSQGKRDRVYCALQILSVLEEPTQITENPAK